MGSYFAELGGNDAVMSSDVFCGLPEAQRAAVLFRFATLMAPAILSSVDASGDPITLRGRYAVHEMTARLSLDGGFHLSLTPRRPLALEMTMRGGPDDPSRRALDALPHNVPALLGQLLDSVPDYRSALHVSREQIAYQLDEPTLLALSPSAHQRLSSIAHLIAYIAVECETRWPVDPEAPLRQPVVDTTTQAWPLAERDPQMQAPPVPGYGAPRPPR